MTSKSTTTSSSNNSGSKSGIDNKFEGYNDKKEKLFKAETVGLVSLEDFRKKRLDIENGELDPDRKLKQKKRKSKVETTKLSFDVEEEEEDEQDTPEDKKLKITKNPDVQTNFLPDKEREEREKQEREQLAKQWKEEQEKIKAEPLELCYTLWDNDTSDRELMHTVVKKGSTIFSFLETAKQEYKELRALSTNDIMFVKQDLIISQHYTFYDLLLCQSDNALFPFEFKQDTVKQKENAVKLVDRRWYERNKHIYPCSMWQVFDPATQSDKFGS